MKKIKSNIGTKLACKGWHQEAALRMLMNNLDPKVAERPNELIVYGGRGKAARNQECYNAIVKSLKKSVGDGSDFEHIRGAKILFISIARCSAPSAG